MRKKKRWKRKTKKKTVQRRRASASSLCVDKRRFAKKIKRGIIKLLSRRWLFERKKKPIHTLRKATTPWRPRTHTRKKKKRRKRDKCVELGCRQTEKKKKRPRRLFAEVDGCTETDNVRQKSTCLFACLFVCLFIIIQRCDSDLKGKRKSSGFHQHN